MADVSLLSPGGARHRSVGAGTVWAHENETALTCAGCGSKIYRPERNFEVPRDKVNLYYWHLQDEIPTLGFLRVAESCAACGEKLDLEVTLTFRPWPWRGGFSSHAQQGTHHHPVPRTERKHVGAGGAGGGVPIDAATLALLDCFEQSNLEEMALPPMPNWKRRQIHENCNGFGSTHNIRSRSEGEEPNRYVVLYKAGPPPPPPRSSSRGGSNWRQQAPAN